MKFSIVAPSSAPLEDGMRGLASSLERAGHEVARAATLAEAPASQAYLLVGSDTTALLAELTATREKDRGRLRRVVLMGPTQGFRRGSQLVDTGSVADLLESFELGGSFDARALSSWRESSWFSGPKVLMSALNSNALKVFQSDHYAVWFAPPGSAVEDFLVRYVAALDGWLSRGKTLHSDG